MLSEWSPWNKTPKQSYAVNFDLSVGYHTDHLHKQMAGGHTSVSYKTIIWLLKNDGGQYTEYKINRQANYE